MFSRKAGQCVSAGGPPRRDECSGAPHWPVRCDNLTGHDTSEYADTMRDEYAVGVHAGVVGRTRKGYLMFAWLLQYPYIPC